MEQEKNVLDHIEFTFENVDFADIDAKNVKSLDIYDIKHSCELNADGVVEDNYSCQSISLCIKYKESNEDETFALAQDGSKLHVADRLDACRDITHITLYYKSGKAIDIVVPWNFRSDYYNENMLVKIDKKNNEESIFISDSEDELKHFSFFMIG